MQSCRKPHLVLVLYRINCASLRLLVYPHLYIVFQGEEAACFYADQFFFHLPAAIHLRHIYRRTVLASRSLHRHADGVYIGFWNDFVIPDKAVPF